MLPLAATFANRLPARSPGARTRGSKPREEPRLGLVGRCGSGPAPLPCRGATVAAPLGKIRSAPPRKSGLPTAGQNAAPRSWQKADPRG